MIREQLEMDDLIEQGRQLARNSDRPVLVSQVMPIPPLDPLSFFAAAGPKYGGTRVYWSTPDQEQILIGLGTAFKIESDRPNRFEEIAHRWSELGKQAIICSDAMENIGTGPLLLGGFSFDAVVDDPLWRAYRPASFVLPQILYTKNNEQHFLTINYYLQPDDAHLTHEKYDAIYWGEQLIKLSQNEVQQEYRSPSFQLLATADFDQWQERVGQAVQLIKNGPIEKVVLARRVEGISQEPLKPEPILSKLIEKQTASYIFAIERGNQIFMGASPEQLIKKKESVLVSTCLAGSIARGETPEQDRALSQSLLADQKNRLEHEYVVRMIKEALADQCAHLQVGDEPVILKTAQIQHLYTPVTGVLKPDVSLLSLVEKLHPTPALGGYPKEEAMQIIRHLEPFERGWYAAPIGWIDHQNNGEFAVGIRSGLIKGHKAVLYAGCGIVAESDPFAEYEETNIKLKPMLSALGGHIQ